MTSGADPAGRSATAGRPWVRTVPGAVGRIARWGVQRLCKALGRRRRQVRRAPVSAGAPMAMVIDIERLQAVRDGLGPHTSERLLAMLAARVRAVLRAEDTVTSFDQGRLVAMLHGALSPREALAIAERTVRTLTTPVVVQGYKVVVGARVAFGGMSVPEEAAAASDTDGAFNGVRIPVQFRLERQPRFLEIVRRGGRGIPSQGALP